MQFCWDFLGLPAGLVEIQLGKLLLVELSNLIYNLEHILEGLLGMKRFFVKKTEYFFLLSESV